MLTRTPDLMIAALLPCLALLPWSNAHAGAPMDEPPLADAPTLRIAGDEAPAPALAPAPPELEQEAPALELPALELPAPAPSLNAYPEPAPRQIDGKRPMPGTGLMVFGGFGLAASSMLAMTALAGPGWLDLEQEQAAIIGGMSLPTALFGGLMIAGGSKSARRYQSWADRNGLYPPKSGNGLLVAGSLVSLGFVAAAGYGVYWANGKPVRERGDWAPAIGSSVGAAFGLFVLSAGMRARSKFVRWERAAYLSPGPLALQRGAGLALTGRF